jgi:hypothetical protein
MAIQRTAVRPKGQLFELIIAFFASRERYEDIQLGKKIPLEDKSKTLDLDVLGRSNRKGVFFECKGIAADRTVEHEEVKKHFTIRTPATRSMLLKDLINPYNKFESILVTSGTFSDETLNAFNQGKFKAKSDTKLELWDRARLIEKLREAGHTPIVRILEKFFGPRNKKKD